MLARTIYVVFGTAAFIGVLWLEETGNYEALLILAGVSLLVLFCAGAFLYIASAPRESAIMDKVLNRRSAKAIAKELLARVGRK